MKKIATSFVIAAVVVFATRAIYHKYQGCRNGSLLSSAETQTLRDAPNSDNSDLNVTNAKELLSGLKDQNNTADLPKAPAVPVAQPTTDVSDQAYDLGIAVGMKVAANALHIWAQQQIEFMHKERISRPGGVSPAWLTLDNNARGISFSLWQSLNQLRNQARTSCLQLSLRQLAAEFDTSVLVEETKVSPYAPQGESYVSYLRGIDRRANHMLTLDETVKQCWAGQK